MARKKIPEKKSPKINKVADLFASFRPAREVLTRVRAVPTWFIQFDHAGRVAGWPIHRFGLVHGPSTGGKTQFVLGLMGSFLELDHYAFFLDLELTTPVDWVERSLGKLTNSDRFLSEKVDTLEGARDLVSAFLKKFIAGKADGKLSPNTSAIIVVDSLDKLVPKDQFEMLLKESSAASKVGMDGMRGMAGMRRAALIKSWLDELVPQLDKAGAALVMIARETMDPNADAWARKFGNDYKISGGRHPFFDASIVCRVELAGYFGLKSDEKNTIYGERHRVTIRKSKVAGKDGRQSVAHFHTSNGVWIPEGFDRARDALELGKHFGVVKAAGSGLHWGQHKWRGEHAAVKELSGNSEQLLALQEAVRGKFEEVDPLEHDENGEVA